MTAEIIAFGQYVVTPIVVGVVIVLIGRALFE